jgi:uncharacterized protein
LRDTAGQLGDGSLKCTAESGALWPCGTGCGTRTYVDLICTYKVCTITDVEFVWDPKKERENIKKHGVSFSDAMTVFYDPLAKVTSDPDHSEDEDRFILIGQSQRRRLLFVVHVYRSESERVRIISARKATKKENADFEEI